MTGDSGVITLSERVQCAGLPGGGGMPSPFRNIQAAVSICFAMIETLPEDRGTYVLIMSVSQMQRLDVGSLGVCEVVPGYYLYVGSAFGSGGLRARIGHHLESVAAPHWHLDCPPPFLTLRRHVPDYQNLSD